MLSTCKLRLMQVSSSLRVYPRTPQSQYSSSKQVSRTSTKTLSVRLPTPTLSILAYPSSAMSGTFGKNFFNPGFEWGFITVRVLVSTHISA